MAHCIISSELPPLIDLTRTPIAYGDRALPRMNEELHSESLLLRQRALRSLSDHLHDPEHIATSVEVGIVNSLESLLHDDNEIVRRLATECLYLMASHALGRAAIIECEVIPSVARLLDDAELIVRLNAHKILKNLSDTFEGAAAVVEHGLVKILVEKVSNEHNEIKLLMLCTLHFLLRLDTEVALENEAMSIMTNFLSHEEAQIRSLAARVIMDLSVPLDGKNRAVECGTMKSLVNLLNDPLADIRANAAGAIMFITVTTTGKYEAIACDAVQALLALVDDRTSEVRLNAIKALGSLAEAPEARQELLEHVEEIRHHESDHIPAVVKAAIRTVEIITWLPGYPYYPSTLPVNPYA